MDSETTRTYTLDVTGTTVPQVSGHLKLGGRSPSGETIAFTNYVMLRDGKPCIPVMGEFHFSRYRHQDWEEELRKIKAGGVDIVATYVFWNHIEEDEGVFDWTGNRNLRQFVALCGRCGLEVIVRLGPFAHGECRNGGLPDWLYGRPFEVRSLDPRFLAYTRRLYHEIARQIDGLLFKDGGPVIGVQLDNEYMHCGAPWETPFRPGTEWVPSGSDGAAYLMALKQIALDEGLDVPIYSVTAWLRSPVPEDEALPMQGGYVFTPWNPDPNYVQPPTVEFLFRDRWLHPVTGGEPTYDPTRYPLACCEIGGGIMTTYYHRPIVPPEAVEGLAFMNLASGANLIGYYMYHGGTNPVGKHGYLNEFTVPRLSYDFQAPIREFGQIANSFRALRLLHTFLKDFGDLLAPMRVVLPDNAVTTPEDTTTLRYAARASDGAGFLFINSYQDHVETQDIPDVCVEVQTTRGTLSIPRAQPMTVQKNVSAILPFGLALDGVRLQHATTQLLARIEADSTINYVFFAPRGMVSEYAFETDSFESLVVAGGAVIEASAATIVRVVPGLDCALTFTAGGKMVRVLTLTREQAERGTKQTLWGRERFVISEATLISSDDGAYLLSEGQNEADLLVFPPPDGTLETPFGPCAETEAGPFRRYTARAPQKEINLSVERLTPDKAVVRLLPDLHDGTSNVYLRVEYAGDIGNCFIDGKLVSDNFYNGTPWEIGLLQIAPEPAGVELFFLITPITRQSGAQTYTPTGMTFRPDVDAEQIAAIDRISAVAEYKIPLRLVLS